MINSGYRNVKIEFSHHIGYVIVYIWEITTLILVSVEDIAILNQDFHVSAQDGRLWNSWNIIPEFYNNKKNISTCYKSMVCPCLMLWRCYFCFLLLSET